MTDDVKVELGIKRQRVIDFLSREQLDAVLISQHENIAWFTAGQVDVRIGVLRETGAARLLLTKEGTAYYLTTNNEAGARMGRADVCGRTQGFAWNPSLDGAKVEDRILLRNGSLKVMTQTPELPLVETAVGGTLYSSAGYSGWIDG